MCGADIFLGLLAVIFPPLPVWVKRGICSADSLINILLCILGFLPGLLHAWYIIAKFPEPDINHEPHPQQIESGRIVYAVAPGPGSRQSSQRKQGPLAANPVNYGTVSQNPSAAGPSAVQGQSETDRLVPPSYAEALGDHKTQTL